jgi:hypothetical protein
MPLNMGELLGGGGPVVTSPNPSPSQAIAQHATGVSNTAGARAQSNAAADTNAKSTMHYAALIVVGSVVALWMLGGLVLKTANL